MRKNPLFVSCMAAGVIATVFAFSGHHSTASAGAKAKNLKIFPKNIDSKALKTEMKKISKALGVQCDHCHNMDAMEEDTPMKTKAISMMKMTASLNKSLKKDGFKSEVSCKTCHGGSSKPKS